MTTLARQLKMTEKIKGQYIAAISCPFLNLKYHRAGTIGHFVMAAPSVYETRYLKGSPSAQNIYAMASSMTNVNLF
jgi:hypothetical protein